MFAVCVVRSFVEGVTFIAQLDQSVNLPESRSRNWGFVFIVVYGCGEEFAHMPYIDGLGMEAVYDCDDGSRKCIKICGCELLLC